MTCSIRQASRSADAGSTPASVSKSVKKSSSRIRIIILASTTLAVFAAASLRRDPQARRKAVEAGYDIHTSAAVLQEFYLRRYAEVTA